MVGETEFLTTAIPVFLSIFIPGFFIALALLKKTKMPLTEIAVFGFILGLIIPPLILFIYSLFGILYSPQLVIVNLVIVTAVGLLLCVREDALHFKLSFHYRRDAVWVLLLVIMLFAFWVRIQSLSPIFYEFDPYYYDQMSEFILTQGQVPQIDHLAWYPYNDSHRNAPLTNYLGVQWYAIHGYVTNNQTFDNYLLATIESGAYPAVVGALICFAVFVLVSEAYNRRYGLIAATVVAVIPMAIEKFAAGEGEQQPWGVFAAFLFYAAYALTISKKDRRYAILAGVAALAATMGSKQDVLIYLVAAGYVGLQSLINYLQNRSNWKLIELNAIILPFIVFAYILFSVYVGWDTPGDIMGFCLAIVFALGLEMIGQRAKTQDDRINYLMGYLVLGAVVALITFIPSFPIPVGPRVWNYIASTASIAKPSSALMMTVAEQSPTGQDFAGSIGFLGSPIDAIGSNAVYLIMILSGIAILYSIYRGSELGVLFAIMIFPVAYVGLNMSKYVLHLAFMIGIAFVILFGELDKLLHNTLKKEFGVEWGVFAVALIVLAAECFIYPAGNQIIVGGPVGDVVSGILDSKYQTANASVNFGRDCSLLEKDNKFISEYLFCNQIPEYWRDPMEWIKNNVASGDRVISWWDYGHWINYFGQSECITRNDHAHPDMDLEVADKFVANTPEALKEYMVAHQAKYALFDQDLISKWGALNYLSCVYNNGTNMTFAYEEGAKYNNPSMPYVLGTSACEIEHNFETIFVPVQPTINDICQPSSPTNTYYMARSQLGALMGYSYCVSFANGSNTISSIVYADNMSRIEHAVPISEGVQNIGGQQYYAYTMLYTKDVWPDGQSSWNDRKGYFYDSNFYQAFYLGQLNGFTQVYPPLNESTGGLVPVRIYKING